MTPVYLNPPPSPFPFVEMKEEQNLQLYLSPQQPADHSSLSAPTNYFFNSTVPNQDQRVLSTKLDEEPKPHDHKVNSMLMSTHERSSDMQQASSSSSLLQESAIQDQRSFGRKEEDHIHGDYESESDNGSTVKWMSSKMRLMKRMMNKSNCGNSTTGSPDNNNNKPLKFKFHRYPTQYSDETNSFGKTSDNTVRVCSDCSTTTTPLWRSGPRGPKSLCNACGIRQRKARRAMEAAAAANGAATIATDTTASSATSMKIKVNINKDKKGRTSYIGQYKKQSSSPQTQKKLICFKELALNLSKNSALQRVFPQDVEDAAILLMELSCGPCSQLKHNFSPNNKFCFY